MGLPVASVRLDHGSPVSRQKARMAAASSSGHSDGRKCPQPSPIAPFLPPLCRCRSSFTDPMYRRMRKALIREIAPDTVLDWVEAEEYVMAQCLASQPGHRA